MTTIKKLIIFCTLLLSVNHPSFAEEWSDYYDYQEKHMLQTRELAKEADSIFEQRGEIRGLMIELGSGIGEDARYFMSRGWQVLAVDSNDEAIDLVSEKAEKNSKLASKLSVLRSMFETMPFPFLKSVDLVYASNTIPFCNPKDFHKFWQNIITLVNPEGIIAVTLFGDRHSWTDDPSMTFVTKSQVENLFKDFEFIRFEETDEVEDAAFEKNVRWHQFHIVAKKKTQTN